MIIRQAQQSDYSEIANVTASAFQAVKHSNQSEPFIIARLRAANALTLSLVAVEHGNIIGHIAFSPVTINGKSCGWFGLGPVSVSPERQNQGVGSALIHRGLTELRSRGATGCVLLGEPEYYCRFGFERDECLRYEDAPAEYFLRLKLTDDSAPTGQVEYHPAFTDE